MSSSISSRRVPWIAMALSLLSAGVGHLYCGRIARGLPLYFAWLIVPACGILATTVGPSGLGLGLLLLPAVVVLGVYLAAAIDAFRLAGQIGSEFSLRDYNRGWIYWLLIACQLVFSIGLMWGMSKVVYQPFVIPSKSMSPTILAGDRVLARKLRSPDHSPERGALIVYRNPMSKGAPRFLGRVVAVAGDEVKIADENLMINGKELERDRIPDGSLKHLGEQVSGQVAFEENAGRRYLVLYDDSAKAGPGQRDFETTVPERHVLVLGDNRDRSNDSRNFGAIHLGDVVGSVDYIYWPSVTWSRFGVADDRMP